MWEIIAALGGVAFIAWRAGNLAQLGACLACGRWQVIGALRHLAWS